MLSREMLVQAIAILDLLVMVGTGLVAKAVYVGEYADDPTMQWGGYHATIIITAFIFLLISKQHGQYDYRKIGNFSWQIASLISISVAAFVTTFTILFFFKISAQFSRVWFVLWGVSFIAALLLVRTFSAVHVRHLIQTGVLRRAVAVIGGGPQFRAMRDRIASDVQQFNIICGAEICDFQENDATVREQISKLLRELQLTTVDEIIVSVPASEGRLLETIVRQVQLLPTDITVLPDLGGADIQMMHLCRTGPFQLIKTVSKPLSGWGVFVKIAEDYILASLALLLSLPAMLLIALAIKVDGPGPVFFRQRRHGYNHQIIEVLKFRTMTVLEDGDTIAQATKNDARVTRVGRLLRRTSLDELPQFINVLRGEMSIVGPRPHALAHNSHYGELVENYANRHRVKPGITGWAQIHGFRGETHNAAMMGQRVKYDLEYIERWSLWLDLKIMIMTPLFGFFRNGAY
jgi:Undecaprenyl-phosphate glucose phosphotransferase